MKSKHKILYFLIIFILYIKPTYAETTISLECPQTSTTNTTINCQVVANSTTEISAISINLKVSNNLKLIKFIPDPTWQGTGDEGLIKLYTYPNQKGTIKLGIANIQVTDSTTSRTGTIYLENTKFYLNDFSEISSNNKAVNLKILSNNNYLSNITINKGTISPTFNKTITNYQATIDNNTIEISATPEENTATIKGIGTQKLNYGNNTFIITVTSQSGIKREYTLNITRPNSKEDPSVIPPTENNTSKEEIKQNPSPSETPTTSESSNTTQQIKLKDLIVEGYQINFKEDKNNYTIKLINNEKNLNIKAIPNSDNIKVTITGNDNLKEGTNEILITLTNDEGLKNTYKITATIPGKTCLIKKINISGYSINFKCNKYEYNLKIKEEDRLNIEVLPTDSTTKINIYNNNNLKNNDTITISVKQDNTEYKYLINITKPTQSSINFLTTKKELIITIITIIALLYLTAHFIIRKKHQKTKKD